MKKILFLSMFAAAVLAGCDKPDAGEGNNDGKDDKEVAATDFTVYYAEEEVNLDEPFILDIDGTVEFTVNVEPSEADQDSWTIDYPENEFIENDKNTLSFKGLKEGEVIVTITVGEITKELTLKVLPAFFITPAERSALAGKEVTISANAPVKTWQKMDQSGVVIMKGESAVIPVSGNTKTCRLALPLYAVGTEIVDGIVTVTAIAEDGRTASQTVLSCGWRPAFVDPDTDEEIDPDDNELTTGDLFKICVKESDGDIRPLADWSSLIQITAPDFTFMETAQNGYVYEISEETASDFTIKVNNRLDFIWELSLNHGL